MLILLQSYTDPYFNIATEEYLLKNFLEDIFILYINEPSIIVGKHQNTLAEINLEYTRSRNLKVVRRLSGGGTVYHDLGNLNYSFIANGSEGNLVDFRKFTQPIIDVLQGLGVDAKIGGKNDIRVDGKKISGNAEHVFKTRVLHHGTLLFSSQLDELNESIKVNPNTYTDKAVKSIRSQVVNISDYLKEQITIDDFSKAIVNHIKKTLPNCQDYLLTPNDTESINRLVLSKYSTWEWNFGYSPNYVMDREIDSGTSVLKIHLRVEKGIISQVKFEDESLSQVKLSELEQILLSCPHDIDEIANKLSTITLERYIPSVSANQLLQGLL